MKNQTVVTEFILLGLSEDPQVQIFLFFVFLIIYATTLLGNSVIILIIRAEPGLHTPMFFFLSQLAFVDICFSSITVPKLLANFIQQKKTISPVGCITQIFFFFLFGCTENVLLSVMAYDRYIAICNPLHYSINMRKQVFTQLVAGAWAISFLDALINTVPLKDLTFCRHNIIRHYTCELPSVLRLSCSEPFTNYMIILISGSFFGFAPLLLILVSYTYIIGTILNIRSAEGRSKAFSTCSSHLIVVCLLYFSGLFEYLKSGSKSFTELDSIFSIQYLILTPMLNPIIYSLKNQEIKAIIWKRFNKFR
ncbi:olfactory receptor 8S1-like [Varanus komodoensis]|uniref:olfactory receptor 8S1-like n=1 Tax=Varanus komodoensis TaxID=61221 RepID=UPI001CF7AEFA|nr:olfactory receptor 8S1-like [Varanus komodoensis]